MRLQLHSNAWQVIGSLPVVAEAVQARTRSIADAASTERDDVSFTAAIGNSGGVGQMGKPQTKRLAAWRGIVVPADPKSAAIARKLTILEKYL